MLAHELLHLALRTHDRAKGADRLEFNYAHDYIINDILRTELGHADSRRRARHAGRAREVGRGDRARDAPQPAGADARPACGRARRPRRGASSAAGRARAATGAEAGDVLDDVRERELFPDEPRRRPAHARSGSREMAAKALGLARAMGPRKGLRGTDAGAASQTVLALRGLYRTPWELALQRWIESVAPGDRTFARPSRRERGAHRRRPAGTPARGLDPQRRARHQRLDDRRDPARARHDRRVLRRGGASTRCASSSATPRSRATNCCARTSWPSGEVEGYGGSDLSPAMRQLADDQHVRAAVVVTDGDIAYPAEPMPYDVLWVVPARWAAFNPPYGASSRCSLGGRRL